MDVLGTLGNDTGTLGNGACTLTYLCRVAAVSEGSVFELFLQHQKTHFRLTMTTPYFHSLIETLRSHFNLANPRFNTLIVSQFLDSCQLLRINVFILTAIFENANERKRRV